MPADGEALLVGQAGLLDVDVDVAHRVGHAHRLVLRPAGVGVGDEDVAGLEAPRRAARMRAMSVVGVAAHLELELGVALGAIAGDARGHRLGRLLRDGAVQREVVADAAAEQRARPAGPLALPRMSQQAMSMADFT